MLALVCKMHATTPFDKIGTGPDRHIFKYPLNFVKPCRRINSRPPPPLLIVVGLCFGIWRRLLGRLKNTMTFKVIVVYVMGL